MMLTRMNAPMDSYLQPSIWLDYDHSLIQQTLHQLVPVGSDEIRTIEVLYTFVRDKIQHSYDAQLNQVTISASDTLREEHGICYAKSHLLAAMLRACGIPSGMCYQRLTLYETAESGFCIHALNTVYIRQLDMWIRLDARGNKPGVDARFSLETEHLAFPVRQDIGEVDYDVNFSEPHPIIIETLMAHTHSIRMYERHLPDSLPLPESILPKK
jgi:transglutaminase-like putative cysteine protease